MKNKLFMIFLMFFLLVKKVSAYYYEPSYFFYSIWDSLRYGSMGLYWQASPLYLLVITALLYAVLFPLSKKMKIFENNTGAATIFALVLSLLVAWVGPFAYWLAIVIYYSSLIAILLLVVFIGIGIYLTLGSGIHKASKRVSEAKKESYGAKKGLEETKKGYEEARAARRGATKAMSAARRAKTHLKSGNIEKFVKDLKEIDDKRRNIGNLLGNLTTISTNAGVIKNDVHKTTMIATDTEKINLKLTIRGVADKISSLETKAVSKVQDIKSNRDQIATELKDAKEGNISKAMSLLDSIYSDMKEVKEIFKAVEGLEKELKNKYEKFKTL